MFNNTKIYCNCLSFFLGILLLGKHLFINVFANLLLHLQVVPAWLNCLPIKGDLIEAKVVHDQLCSMAERLAAQISLGFFCPIALVLIFLLYLQVRQLSLRPKQSIPSQNSSGICRG